MASLFSYFEYSSLFIFSNFDLCHNICKYVDVGDLLSIERVNKVCYNAVQLTLNEMKHSNDYDYLLNNHFEYDLRKIDICNPIKKEYKKALYRIYKNRKNNSGGILMLGGSFGALSNTL